MKNIKNTRPQKEVNRRCARCGEYHTQVVSSQKLLSNTLVDKIYLGISVSIFLFISLILGYVLLVEYLTGFKITFFVFLFFYFFIFLFFCFFVFLPYFFTKRCIVKITSYTSLIIIIISFILGPSSTLGPGSFKTEASVLNIVYNITIYGFDVRYALLLTYVTSLISIIFFFKKDKCFIKNCKYKNAKKWFILLIVFLMLIPNFIHLFN